MTAKEKAEELVAAFRIVNYDLDDIDNHKECALIAVDEIIDATNTLGFKDITYYQEVKAEIQNIS